MSKQSIIQQELIDFGAATYDVMTDQQAANEFNAVDKVQNKASMTRQEVIREFNVTELDALTTDNISKVFGILSDTVDPFDPVVVHVITIAFGGGATLTALGVARVETVSRASQLGLGRVSLGDIINARA